MMRLDHILQSGWQGDFEKAKRKWIEDCGRFFDHQKSLALERAIPCRRCCNEDPANLKFVTFSGSLGWKLVCQCGKSETAHVTLQLDCGNLYQQVVFGPDDT